MKPRGVNFAGMRQKRGVDETREVHLDGSGADKDLWGLYPCMGSENKEFWLEVFNDLLDRGLKRLLMVLSDDFGGLIESVQTLFPQAYHQLCYKHLQAH